MPESTFIQSAEYLRGYDRITVANSALSLLDVLHEVSPVYRTVEPHPAVRMWRGYELQLANYGLSLIEPASSHNLLYVGLHGHLAAATESSMDIPQWMGNDLLHRSHRDWLAFARPSMYRAAWQHLNERSKSYLPSNVPTPVIYWPDALTGN